MGYRAGISPLDVIILGGIAYTGEKGPDKPSSLLSSLPPPLPRSLPPFTLLDSLLILLFPSLLPLLSRSL